MLVVPLVGSLAAVSCEPPPAKPPDVEPTRTRWAPPKAAACTPAEPGPAGCFSGNDFLDCPGEGTPALFCSKHACKWISHGRAVAPFIHRIEPGCVCTGPECDGVRSFGAIMRSGGRAWTRRRELTLGVTVGPAPERGSITCSGCGFGCTGGDNPCSGCGAGDSGCKEGFIELRKRFGDTFVVTGATTGGTYGWDLVIEVDVATSPPGARACRFSYSDALECRPYPLDCAMSGTVALNRLPSREDCAVGGQFVAKFVDGLEIRGGFQ